MSNEKEIVVNACGYKDLAKNCKIYNKNELEYFTWIYLDPEDVRDATLLDVQEMNDGPTDFRYNHNVIQRKSTCWLRCITEFLNLLPGKHTYKISMINRVTDSVFSLYISYIIQDDNPDKPYKYMKEEQE